MRLVHEDTRLPVKVGDTLKFSFATGDTTVLRYIQEPHKPASTGRVYVSRREGDMQQSYFPSVFNLVWEGRDDQ